MSALFVQTEMQADVLDFTWDGGQRTVVNEFSTTMPLNLDQIFGPTDFLVQNRLITYGSYMFPDAIWQFIIPRNYGSGICPLSPGDQLSPSNFSGEPQFDFFFVGTEASPQYLGFCTRENNVGWFKVYFQNSDSDDLVIEAGELATAGEALTVGGTEQLVLGDANCNGIVSILDVASFVDQVSSGTYVDKSDMNRDGAVDLLDVGPFVSLLSGSGLAFVENGELRVRTTTSADAIDVSQAGDVIRVVVDGTELGEFVADRITIEALQGNDTIIVHPSVTLETNIYAGPGDDTVFGGSGSDNIFGAQGDDVIFGRGGDDYLVGAAGSNEIHGQDGADVIYGGQFGTVFGGNGDDCLFGWNFADHIVGGAGDDRIFSGDGDDVVEGGLGNDVLRSESGDDIVHGGAGDDNIRGSFGNDVLRGGLGNDTIRGDEGDDTLAGQGGNDNLRGGSGFDSAEDFGELGHLSIEKDLF